MVDDPKAKSAKERLKAAKESAEEAEVVESAADSVTEITENAAEAAADKVEDVVEAAETTDAPEETSADETDTAEVAAEETATEDASSETDAQDAPEATDDSASEQGETAAEEAADDIDKTDADDREPEPEPEPEEPEPQEPEPEEEEGGVSTSGMILRVLAILVVGGGVALWAGPRIAPSLPGWAAPVANFLTPGTDAATARIDAFTAETSARIEQATADIKAAAEAAAADAATATSKADEAVAAVADARTSLGAEIEAVAAEPRADIARLNDLATRLVEAEATVEGLRAEIDALQGVTGENAPPSAEVLSRVAAFGAAVEGLRAEMADLKSRTAEIEALARSEDLDALAKRVAALEGGEAATAGAREEAGVIRRTANLSAALTRIEQALLSGAPYGQALSDATSLSGEAAPEALSAFAASGLPTLDDLIRDFPAAAQAGYAAALEAGAGDDFASRVMAKLQGRLGGRPSAETAGDDAGAVLSRMEARLNEGRYDAVETEAAALAEASQAAMAGWLGEMKKTAEGVAAFADYRAALATN